jgi:ADP-ribose pyrophosphatase YjhB (NUDIX family)
MPGLRSIPTGPCETPVGRLSAQLRRPRPRSVTSAKTSGAAVAGIQFDGARRRIDVKPGHVAQCQSMRRRLTGAPAPASNRAMPMKEPDWLGWARELQAIAQTGLTFCRDPYDRERYEAIRQIAARIFAARTDAPAERIEALFAGETGYATPKVDVRAAVFDDDDRVLMVRETADGGRWTLPGGWADVNRTAAENVVKEALEESGFEVEPLKLAAVWDRTKQGHAPHVFSCCKFFFVCALIGGRATTSHEISEVGWFLEANIPANLSLERVLPQQIRRMFAHRRDPSLPTDFD